MKNPFVHKPVYIVVYTLWWMLPVAIHSFVLNQTYHLKLSITLTEALLSFAVLAILMLSLWYMVKYSNLAFSSLKKTLQNHLISIVIIFLLWLGLSYLIYAVLFDSSIQIFQSSLLWRWLIYLPIYILIVAVYYLMISLDDSKNRAIEQARLNSFVKEAELKELKSQINPHFLFNSLNAVSSMIYTDKDHAHEMIVNISDFFRSTLLASKSRMIHLSEELEHALLYLEIEKARFGDKIQLIVNLPESLNQWSLPSLILQPLVENAIKHGVYESQKTITIQFDFTLMHNQLQVVLQNDIDDTSVSSRKGTGTGLRNVAERLRIIYNQDGLLKVEKTDRSFKVIIRIPEKEYYKDEDDENAN
ncbi:MAG: histidine kinase [Bacteroidales bacterium]|nr:histidine kinase [Bacteroidales bacterium]